MLLQGVQILLSISSSPCSKQLGKDVDFPDNIGIIIESPGFLSYHSGYKNLLYLASLRNRIGKSEIEAAIRKVGLNPADKNVAVGHLDDF